MTHVFTSPGAIHEFVLAGNAIVTLQSDKTGQHYTYRVQRAKGRDDLPADMWFVKLLTGADNNNAYTYIGCMDKRGGDGVGIGLRLTAKSLLKDDAAPVRGWRYMWAAITAGRLPANMTVRHEGRCGRCNRRLTVPESLDRGIGPECAGMVAMGLAA